MLLPFRAPEWVLEFLYFERLEGRILAARPGTALERTGKRGKLGEREYQTCRPACPWSHPMKVIDLRSDTVTKPSAEMRAAMSAAEVGDDVYGEDPTVNRLEALAASLLGKEAALFVCSGTQSNLLALLSHCERGDEYIVGQQGHTYKYEGGGAAVLGSIQPQPLDYDPDGSLDLGRVESAIKPDDSHFAKTRLLCLEKTHGANVLPLDYLRRAQEFTRGRGLGLDRA